MKKQNWFQEAKLRVSLTTPWFFKIVIKAGLFCTATGTGLLLLTAVPNIQLPNWIVPIASHMLVAGVVAAALGKTVTTTPQDLPNNKPNPIPKGTEIDDQQH